MGLRSCIMFQFIWLFPTTFSAEETCVNLAGGGTPNFCSSVLFVCFYRLSWFHSDCDWNLFCYGIALLLQLAHGSTGDPGSLKSVLTPSLTPHLSYSKWCSVPWFPRLHHWHCLAAWCCLLGCSKPAPAMMTSEPWSGFSTAYWIKREANWRNSKAFEWKMCSHDPKICVLWMMANTSFSEHQPTQERLPVTSHKMVHVHMVFWSKQCLQKCCLPLEWFPWPLVPSGWTWTGLKTSFCTAQKVLF